jgi:hypothetical protein
MTRKTKSGVLALVGATAFVAFCFMAAWYIRSSGIVAARNACIGILKDMESAKTHAEIDLKLKPGDSVTAQQVSPYIHGGWSALRCPSGGSLFLNRVGSNATCTIPGHAIP